MTRFKLSDTAKTDIQTTFRYEVVILTNDEAAKLNHLQDQIVGYATSAELPCAPGDPIAWYMPMGMRNWQAGKRQTKDITLEFVVPTNDALQRKSIYYMLETWQNNTYNLNRGVNAGKANYCTDSIFIRLRTERDKIAYSFQLLRAQPTQVNFGSLSSEGNELVKVSMTLAYDNYKIFAGSDSQIILEDSTAYL
nr:MAG TPA: Baseplate wedge protein [Caudoviricetes sp.]